MSNAQVSEWDDAPAIPSPINLNLLSIVFRRKWILLAGLLVGSVASFARYSGTDPVFESRAEVLIQREDQRPAS